MICAKHCMQQPSQTLLRKELAIACEFHEKECSQRAATIEGMGSCGSHVDVSRPFPPSNQDVAGLAYRWMASMLGKLWWTELATPERQQLRKPDLSVESLSCNSVIYSPPQILPDSGWTARIPPGVRVESYQSPTRVRPKSEWSLTKVQVESNQSPTRIWPKSKWSPTKVRVESNQSLTKVQVESEWSPTKSKWSPTKVQAKSKLSPSGVRVESPLGSKPSKQAHWSAIKGGAYWSCSTCFMVL
jgi:hypothetical protein